MKRACVWWRWALVVGVAAAVSGSVDAQALRDPFTGAATDDGGSVGTGRLETETMGAVLAPILPNVPSTRGALAPTTKAQPPVETAQVTQQEKDNATDIAEVPQKPQRAPDNNARLVGVESAVILAVVAAVVALLAFVFQRRSGRPTQQKGASFAWRPERSGWGDVQPSVSTSPARLCVLWCLAENRDPMRQSLLYSDLDYAAI